MEDQKIIESFLARDESAIPRTMEKYADFCRNIASGILLDPQAVEQCLQAVCETLWASLPEKGTNNLPVYLARVTRTVSMNHWKQLPGDIRKETQVYPATEELSHCILPVREDSPPLDRKVLVHDLNQFLSELDDVSRAVFIGRYWYFHTVERLAAEQGIGPDVIEASLIRSRELLRQKISYPLKAGNLISSLGKVSGRFILHADTADNRPARRPRKKKKNALKLIIAGAATLILIGGLAIAWVCGAFSNDDAGPDGLQDVSSRPAVGLNEDDTSSEKLTDYGSFVDVGSCKVTVLTAGYDDTQISILVKAVPASSDIFLIPKDLDRDDSTRSLIGLNGIPEGTVDQYASYLGRTLAKFTFTCYINGTQPDSDLEYAFGPDGVLYYCFTAPLPEDDAEQILIAGSFYQDLEEASDAQNAEIAVKLMQLPDPEETTATSFAAAASDDSGLQIHSALIEKTGLGYHVTFEIEMSSEQELLFLITDSNGDPLPAFPGYAEAVTGETGDGSRTFRVSSLTPADSGELYFTVTDQDTGIEYGPYAIK